MARYPSAFGHTLVDADLAIHGAIAVAFAGDPGTAPFGALTAVLADSYVPGLVLAGGLSQDAGGIALLADRIPRDGQPTAYVCRRYVCESPQRDPAGLAEQLERALQ
jgi:uncharacterized protein YyaL (SSP411 family)